MSFLLTVIISSANSHYHYLEKEKWVKRKEGFKKLWQTRNRDFSKKPRELIKETKGLRTAFLVC